jgi:serine/threonine protein phosphatase PrpC
MSGTTCTLIIIIGDTIYFGFVGDSLMCMSKYMNAVSDKFAHNNDFIITKPWHVPSESKEKNRIYKCRGEVRGEKVVKPKK